MLEMCQTWGRRILDKLGRIDRCDRIVGNHTMEHTVKEWDSVLVMSRQGISRKIAPSCKEDPARFQCSQPCLLLIFPPYLRVIPLIPKVVGN